MFCPKCGNQLRENAKFCTGCGASVAALAAAPVTPAAPVEPAPPVAPVPPVASQRPVEPAPPVNPAPPVQEAPKKKKTGLIIGIVAAVLVVALAIVAVVVVIPMINQKNDYDEAVALMEEGNYEDALDIFESLGDYKDSADIVEELEENQEKYDEAMALIDEDRYEEALELLKELGDYRGSDALATELEENQAKYDQAMTLLDEGGYDEALTILTELGDYRDSETIVAEFAQKQEAYDNAMALLDGNDFSGAADAFLALGNYRDSETMAEYEVPYRKGLYLMANASYAWDYDDAAELFASLGDYNDAAAKAMECYLSAGRLALADEDWGDVQYYLDCMDEETKAVFMADLEAVSADSAALETVIACLQDVVNYAGGVDAGYVAMLRQQIVLLGEYDPLYFLDEKLKDLVMTYLEGLRMEAAALNSDGTVNDLAGMYESYIVQCDALDALDLQYGFLENHQELREEFIGYGDYYRNVRDITVDMKEQVDGQPLQNDPSLGQYITYTNNTGCNIRLRYYFEFSSNGTHVAYGAETTVDVMAGETVQLWLNVPAGIPAWDYWTYWRGFEIIE